MCVRKRDIDRGQKVNVRLNSMLSDFLSLTSFVVLYSNCVVLVPNQLLYLSRSHNKKICHLHACLFYMIGVMERVSVG